MQRFACALAAVASLSCSEVTSWQRPEPFQAARASTITENAKVLRDYRGPYPRALIEKGVEGAAVLLVEIRKTGALFAVRLAKSSGNAELDALALKYVERFTFRAARVNGEPVDSVIRYTYRFSIVDARSTTTTSAHAGPQDSPPAQ